MEEETTFPPEILNLKDVRPVDNSVVKFVQKAIGNIHKMEEETTFPPEILNPKDVRPVDNSVIKFVQKAIGNIHKMSTDITKFGDDTYLLKPDDIYYVLYRDNPSCWRKLFNFEKLPWNCLELINTDSLEVKGSAKMEYFIPVLRYAVYFWIEMKEDARFETPCTFTLVVTDGKKTLDLKAQTLNLKGLTPNVLYCVKLGEFTATPTKGEVKFSLTNFDPNWKSGMILVGVVFGPAVRKA